VSDHQCTPKETVVGFWRDCAVCGKEIEPVSCKACDGTGAEFGSLHTSRECRRCKGTGVRRWKEATP
jgi:DnaJ-class molecular chaperone